MSDANDPAFQSACERADELRVELARAKQMADELARSIAAAQSELSRMERAISVRRAQAVEPAPRPKNPDRRDVARRALELIRKAGRPLSRRLLYERLQDVGVTITGMDPEVVLGTMLYRDDRIVRIRNFGYWPKEEVYEPAFYIPEHEAVIGVTHADLSDE